MKTLRFSADLDRAPSLVHQELMDVDRLRDIWAQHRRSQSQEVREAAWEELAHRRVREWGAGPALEELMVSLAADGAAGRPITAAFVVQLSERISDLTSDSSSRPRRHPLDSEQALRVARAAAVPVHPVVRAAHTYAECVTVLDEREPPDEAGTHVWALPWVLAALTLRRADFPPLLPDTLSPPPWVGLGPDERLVELSRHFARMTTGALLEELSWTSEPAAEPHTPASPLATVVRRRVLDYVRSCRESVALILKALDPEARTSVYSGGSDGAEPGTMASEVAGTLLTPGAAHWWTALELSADRASLRLFVVIQEVGRPNTGVLAVTAHARITTPDGTRDALGMSEADNVAVMPTDGADDRWPQIHGLVDEAVSRAMNTLTRV